MEPSGLNPSPIGLLLKCANEQPTASIDSARRANELTRSEWHVLNLRHEWESAPLLRLEEEMQPFLDATELEDRCSRKGGSAAGRAATFG